jgi:hypothetical protein
MHLRHGSPRISKPLMRAGDSMVYLARVLFYDKPNEKHRQIGIWLKKWEEHQEPLELELGLRTEAYLITRTSYGSSVPARVRWEFLPDVKPCPSGVPGVPSWSERRKICEIKRHDPNSDWDPYVRLKRGSPTQYEGIVMDYLQGALIPASIREKLIWKISCNPSELEFESVIESSPASSFADAIDVVVGLLADMDADVDADVVLRKVSPVNTPDLTTLHRQRSLFMLTGEGSPVIIENESPDSGIFPFGPGASRRPEEASPSHGRELRSAGPRSNIPGQSSSAPSRAANNTDATAHQRDKKIFRKSKYCGQEIEFNDSIDALGIRTEDAASDDDGTETVADIGESINEVEDSDGGEVGEEDDDDMAFEDVLAMEPGSHGLAARTASGQSEESDISFEHSLGARTHGNATPAGDSSRMRSRSDFRTTPQQIEHRLESATATNNNMRGRNEVFPPYGTPEICISRDFIPSTAGSARGNTNGGGTPYSSIRTLPSPNIPNTSKHKRNRNVSFVGGPELNLNQRSTSSPGYNEMNRSGNPYGGRSPRGSFNGMSNRSAQEFQNGYANRSAYGSPEPNYAEHNIQGNSENRYHADRRKDRAYTSPSQDLDSNPRSRSPYVSSSSDLHGRDTSGRFQGVHRHDRGNDARYLSPEPNMNAGFAHRTTQSMHQSPYTRIGSASRCELNSPTDFNTAKSPAGPPPVSPHVTVLQSLFEEPRTAPTPPPDFHSFERGRVESPSPSIGTLGRSTKVGLSASRTMFSLKSLRLKKKKSTLEQDEVDE